MLRILANVVQSEIQAREEIQGHIHELEQANQAIAGAAEDKALKPVDRKAIRTVLERFARG